MEDIEVEDRSLFGYPLLQKVEGLDIKDKKYPQGYLPEFDIVNISPNGYIGDVVTIKDEVKGELKIGLPKRLKSDKVLFNKLPKKEQKWKRLPTPSFSNSEDVAKHVSEVVERRLKGMWISINGQEIYITGHLFFYLQIWKDAGRLMRFRYSDLVFFYFWQAILVDKRAFGIDYLKNRRSGFTSKGLSIILNTATITKNKKLGLTSKTSDDAKSMYRTRLVPAFRAMPTYLKPQLETNEIKTQMVFDEPIGRGKDVVIEESRGLGTIIDYRSTSLSSYDGEAIFILLQDEISKLPKDIPYSQWLQRIATTLREGSIILGKMLAGSTYDTIGGEEYEDVWIASSMANEDRDADGQTVSGLYRLFIPTDYAFAGYIDEYGFPIIKDPITPILNDVGEFVDRGFDSYHKSKVALLKKDQRRLHEFLHQNPRSQRQAFIAVDGGSLINMQKANDSLYYIENQDKKPYLEGEFMWRDPDPDRTDFTVDFIHSEQGSFRVYWMPPEELRNNHTIKNGKIYPSNQNLLSCSTDPYRVDKTMDSRSSNGAFELMVLPNVDERLPDDFSVAVVYNKRENTVAEFVDKMIRVTLFYSTENLVERNVTNVIEEFYNRGLTQFVQRRPDVTKLTHDEKKYGGIPNNSERLRQKQGLFIIDWGEKYLGIDSETNKTRTQCLDREVIKQLLKYNPYDRTDSDLGITHGLCLVSIQAKLGKYTRDRNKNKTRKIVSSYNYAKKRYKY